MTLADEEFIRRFLLHVQPPDFPRIRYFGFLANRHRKEKLALCRKLIAESTLSLVPQAEQCRRLNITPNILPQPNLPTVLTHRAGIQIP